MTNAERPSALREDDWLRVGQSLISNEGKGRYRARIIAVTEDKVTIETEDHSAVVLPREPLAALRFGWRPDNASPSVGSERAAPVAGAFKNTADEIEDYIRRVDALTKEHIALTVVWGEWAATRRHLEGDVALRRASLAAAAPPASAVAQIEAWQDMASAPKDGTRILLWMVHENRKWGPADEWEAPVVAYWTTHNGGGWVWHGMSGRPTAWAPLPPAPDQRGEWQGTPVPKEAKA